MAVNKQADRGTSGIKRSLIDNLPVTVDAVLGAATISVGELGALTPGDTFPLDATLADAVELRLNGEIIAYGELVSVGEHFAVRIGAIAKD